MRYLWVSAIDFYISRFYVQVRNARQNRFLSNPDNK